MKKYFVLILMLSTAIPNFAQKNLNDEEDIQTIFSSKDGKVSNGGYLATEVKYTKIMDKDAIMVGGRGGWIINHVFSIGAGGYGLVTSHEIHGYHDSIYYNLYQKERPYYLRTGWGGLYLQYTFFSNSVIHFTVNSLIGAGGVACTPSLKEMSDDEKNMNIVPDYDGSGFFIYEPGIGVELNLLKYFRVEIGGSYRIIAGLDMQDNPETKKPWVTNDELGSWSVNLAFKFGKF